MKSIQIILTFMFISPVLLTAQDNDLQSIKKTLDDYMIGGTERDAERVASAFHPQAMMKFVGNEGYKEVNAADFFRNGIKPGAKVDRICEVEDIDKTGHAATAKILLKYPDKIYTDYMTLLKVDEGWKIVNKSFHLERGN